MRLGQHVAILGVVCSLGCSKEEGGCKGRCGAVTETDAGAAGMGGGTGPARSGESSGDAGGLAEADAGGAAGARPGDPASGSGAGGRDEQQDSERLVLTGTVAERELGLEAVGMIPADVVAGYYPLSGGGALYLMKDGSVLRGLLRIAAKTEVFSETLLCLDELEVSSPNPGHVRFDAATLSRLESCDRSGGSDTLSLFLGADYEDERNLLSLTLEGETVTRRPRSFACLSKSCSISLEPADSHRYLEPSYEDIYFTRGADSAEPVPAQVEVVLREGGLFSVGCSEKATSQVSDEFWVEAEDLGWNSCPGEPIVGSLLIESWENWVR